MGVVKTWNGIARASVKTFDGIASASVKTINGFDAVSGGGDPAAYFGGCNSDGSPLSVSGYEFYSGIYFYNKTATIEYTCPGTGNRTVDAFDIYALSSGSPDGDLRAAIYSNDLSTKVIEWTSALTVSGSVAWRSAPGLSSTTLVGGTKYVIAISASSGNTRCAYNALTNGSNEGFSNYTTGFPTTMGGGSNFNAQFISRIHVAAT